MTYFTIMFHEDSAVANKRCLEENSPLVKEALLVASPYMAHSQCYLETISDHPTDFNMLEAATMIS